MITEKREEQDLAVAQGADTEEPRRPARRMPRRWWVLPVGLVAFVIAAWAIAALVRGNADAPRYLSAPAGYSDINATVEENGTVNPVVEVDVGTQVSGTVTSLSADFNSPVRKGQVLATLDATPFEAASLQAHGAFAAARSTAAAAGSTAAQSLAAVSNAQASARGADAAVNTARAQVAKARAQAALSDATIARDRSLLAQGYIAQNQMDADLAAAHANHADLGSALAGLDAARAQASVAAGQIAAAAAQHQANLRQAEAADAQAMAGEGQVQQADYNLSRAVITSPIDGVVISRSVNVGQTVAASFQTPTLFVIASNLRDMQVDASVSEADVGQLRAGAPARITVPAYPNTTFLGTVRQVRVNPTTTQNVVTYDAIIAVHDASARLMPGMTADVIVSVETRRHVLSVPAAALLFKPGRDAGRTAPGSQTQQQSQAIAGAPGSSASVYVLRDGRPARVPVVIGISDGRTYEIRSGDLRAGDRVIVGQLQTNDYSNTNPMAGGVGFGR